MSREIKFRAWDVQENKMNNSGTIGAGSGADVINISFNGSVSLQNAYGLDMGARNPTFDNASNRFVLMQFTGLKDKYGIDIYEGDIITDEERKDYALVIYSLDTCQFLLEYCEIETQEFYEVNKWAIVSGNIHQNPELLNNK